jgi:hypothetical protein
MSAPPKSSHQKLFDWPLLFFIKRRPKIMIPREFGLTDPNHPLYQSNIEKEGFLNTNSLKKVVPDVELNNFPTLAQDMRDLEQYLLPVFFEFNQGALHYQNRFYLSQWVFLLGAFATTVSGALTTWAYSLEGSNLPAILGVVTAIISAITTFFSFVYEQTSPQKRWTQLRRLAEELRTNYFRYLSHTKPYDKPENRLDELRRLVLAIRRKGNEIGK